MAITNGYCSLADFKARWADVHTYTATTISFTTSSNIIADSVKGLKRFQNGDYIEVSGSTSNDGYYTITTGNVAAQIVTTESLTTEAAGDTVTIAVVSPTDDATLESVIEAVSRAIDHHCGRVFYTSATTARHFMAEDDTLLFVDDLLSIDTDGLVTDEDGDRTYENTWETIDYILLPANASTDGAPYTMIEADPYGSYLFPVDVRRGVKITGTWGYWTSTPKPIKEACILASMQVATRKDAVFGTIGTPGGEAIMQLASDVLYKDPHLQMMLQPYRRLF